MMKENWVYRRGDIYMANLNPFKGSEQGGTRPVLVLQNNRGNLFCPTLIVAPLTTQVNKKKDQPTHYLLSGVRGLPEDSVALLEQIKTIDKSRIISYLGKVSKEEMKGVDEALKISLGIYISEDVAVMHILKVLTVIMNKEKIGVLI